MRSIRRIFVISCLLVITGLIWAGIYARKQGFTNSWREAVENELKQQGHYIDIGKLTLGAFRGLVAEDVKFYRDKEQTELFAEMSDIFLDVGLERVLQKQIRINTLDFQDGRLSFPLNPADPEGRRLQITDLSGRIALTESFVEVVRVDAKLAGVDIFMKGSLLRPRGRQIEDQGKDAIESTVSRIQSLKRFIDTLETFEFMDGPPTIKIEFRGDLLNMKHTTIARADIKAGRFQKKGGDYNVRSLEAEANFDGRIRQLKIPYFELQDRDGVLMMDAVWNHESNQIDFNSKSNVDLVNLLEFFFPNKKWREVVLYHPPNLTAEGTIDLNSANENGSEVFFPGQIIGNFTTEGFGSAGIVFKSSNGDFSVKKDSFYVRNVRVDHKTGTAILNCKFEPGQGEESLQFEGAVKMDPRVFEPFLKEESTRRFLRKWDFNENSGVYFEASGNSSSIRLEDLKAAGSIDLRNFKLNEVPFAELETKFEIDGPERWYRDVQFIRGDGEISATLAYTHTGKRIWEIKGGRSIIDPVEGFAAFSPFLKEKLRPFKFNLPPILKIQGVVDGRTADQRGDTESLHDLEIELAGRGGMNYELFGKEISLDSPDGNILVKGDLLQLKSFHAGFCGGSVDMEMQMPNFQTSDAGFDSTIKASGITIRSLGKYYDFENNGDGDLEGEIRFTGKSSQPELLDGSGVFSVSDRDLFHLPVFNGLEELLINNEQGHARNFKSSKRSSVQFAIDDGILTSDTISLVPGTVNLKGSAVVNFEENTIDAELAPSPSRSRRVYRCSGTINAPEWKASTGSRTPVLSGR